METTRIDKAVQILELEGRAYVIGQDGTLQPVAPGQILLPGTLLVTDENTRIVYDDNPELPAEAALMPMDNDTMAEVDAIQAAILAGLDPTELFEAPAAGPAAGAGPVAAGVAGLGSGNGGFVVVDRVGGFVQPEAGFLTAFNPLAFETVDTLDLLLPGDEPLPPNSIPTIVIIPQPPTDPEGQPQLPGVDGAFSWVSEAALEGGSEAGNGQHVTQGIIAINTGTDALAALEVLVLVQDGTGNWVNVTNGGVVEGLYGTLLINPDFTWTYTLNKNVIHPNAGQVFEKDVLSDVFQVRVTDDDGDIASASLDIFILDDGPLAVNDSASQAEENAPISVDVFANDKAGADGVDLVSGVALVEGSLTGSGDLVYNDDGTFSYTPVAGEDGEVSFQYRLTDGDGDSATATVTITLQGDSTPTVSVLLAEGDDGVVWESALPAGSGGGDLSASGSLDINTGNDALGFIEVQDKDGNWIKINADGTLVPGEHGTLSVNLDGSWTYTLAENTLDHDGIDQTGGADQVQDRFQVRVTDDDGDASPEATLTIQVNDDGPVAEDDSASQANENEQVTIDVFANDKAGADGVDLASGVALVDGSLTGEGSLVYNNDGTFSYTPAAGEDGEVSFQYRLTDGDGDSATATVTITLQGDSTPMVSVLLAEGDDGVVWESALPAGSGGGDLSASGSLDINTGNDALDFIEVQDKDGAWIKIDADGTLVPGEYGTLSVNLDGSWTYTLAENTLDHDGIDQTGGDDQVQDRFQVRVTDDDGDVSPEATLTILINDDGPRVQADNEQDVQVQLDETATTSGVATIDTGTIVKGDDPDVGGSGHISRAESEGALVTLTDEAFGADGPASEDSLVYALTVTQAESGLKVTDGAPISLVLLASGVVVGVVNGGDFDGQAAFAIHVDAATGVVTVEQYLSLLHPDTTNPDDAVPLAAGALGMTVTLTDGDGDSVTSAVVDVSGQILFHDDGPALNGVQHGIMGNFAGTLSGVVDVAFGADGFGSFTLSGTSPNEAITYNTVNNPDGSTVLTATVNGSEDIFFILTLNADGSYDFELVNPNPTVEVTKTLIGLTAGQPVSELVLAINGITATFTELAPTPNNGGINSSGQGMGIDNNQINDNEIMRVDFSSVVANTSFTLVNLRNSNSQTDTLTWAVFNDGVLIAAGTWTPPPGTGQSDITTFNILEPIAGSTMTFSFGSAAAIEANGFDEIHLGAESGDVYRLLSITVSEEIFPDDVNLEFNVAAIDGDGDPVSTGLNITIEGSGTESTGFTLNGTSADEVLLGGAGNDILLGDAGDDILIGGLGDNILTGGDGADIFRFIEADAGSVNTITDFEKGIDQLDLSELLNGEESGNLNDYLNFSLDNGDTLLTVSPGGDGGNEQVIRFENLDLLAAYDVNSSSALINAMLDDQSLMVDKS